MQLPGFTESQRAHYVDQYVFSVVFGSRLHSQALHSLAVVRAAVDPQPRIHALVAGYRDEFSDGPRADGHEPVHQQHDLVCRLLRGSRGRRHSQPESSQPESRFAYICSVAARTCSLHEFEDLTTRVERMDGEDWRECAKAQEEMWIRTESLLIDALEKFEA